MPECSRNVTHGRVFPAPQDSLTKEPIEEEKTRMRGGKRKWSLSATVQELRWRCELKSIRRAPRLRQCIPAILKRSWLNVFLLFIPISWVFHFLNLYNTLVFVFSFFALIPLAKLLEFATEELSQHLGKASAGLLNATLRNAVELIVAIIALVNYKVIGSILSNLLLVLGVCFFAGGTRFSEQGFGMRAAQLNSSLLTLSVVAVLIPAAFYFFLTSDDIDPLTSGREGHDLLAVSRGAAIILLFTYFCDLTFQLFSHKSLYEDNSSDLQWPVPYTPYLARKLRTTSDVEAASKEEDMPRTSFKMAIALLVFVTMVIGITAESLVDSIDGLTSSSQINREFIGFILNPTIGDAAEILTENVAGVPVPVPILTVGVTVGIIVQIALFIIPFITILGWILGKPLTLLLDPFQSIVLFLSVFTVSYVIRDGRSNWLKGMVLICLYIIVGIMFWYYPGSDPGGLLANCT